jgi:hypothetical protein
VGGISIITSPVGSALSGMAASGTPGLFPDGRTADRRNGKNTPAGGIKHKQMAGLSHMPFPAKASWVFNQPIYST